MLNQYLHGKRKDTANEFMFDTFSAFLMKLNQFLIHQKRLILSGMKSANKWIIEICRFEVLGMYSKPNYHNGCLIRLG